MIQLFKNVWVNTSKRAIVIFILCLIMPILLSSCNLLPFPTNNLGNNGNLYIVSEPSGASIILNGVNSGYNSPKLIKNIPAESYLVTLKLEGYLNSNNFVQIYPNQTSQLNVSLTPNPYLDPQDKINLIKIEVEPKLIDLSIGNTGYIHSITAYYSNNTSKIISTNECYIYSTKPNVASVNIDGKITAISEGQTNIWVEYSESNIIKRDSVTVNVLKSIEEIGNLTKIIVLPSTMSLSIGETKAISSITAFYDNNTEKTINPTKCLFSSNNSAVSVNKHGMITGEKAGNSTITVFYTEEDITKIDTISVTVSSITIEQPNYRGLLIGIGDYINYGFEGDLIAPPYDVEKVKKILDDCWFGQEGTTFSRIDTLKDTQATKAKILQKIQSVFSGANQNDISYFYYSGHGYTLNQTSYLCPTDFNGETEEAISVDELETALSAIPGQKIVLIDSCNSGGFIGKSISDNDSDEIINRLASFNESIINTFSNELLPKDLLTSSEYQVLTSSHWDQASYEIQPIEGDPFGVFTQGLYQGCSLDNNVPADANQDDKISLQEAYEFISQWVAFIRYNQNVQVYPLNSNFTVFEY